ncbi:MAG: hypothetical protein ACYTDY_03800 [Planctomycetota bacterium]
MPSENGRVTEELSWVCHPARRRPTAAVVLTLFLAFLWVGVHLSFRDPLITGIAVVLLAVSLAPFYLPTRFRMTEDTVSIRTFLGAGKEKPWSLFRRYQADRHGVLLSPFDHPSRLDRFHGLNLRFDEQDRERVLGYLERRFTKDDREG